MLFILLLRAVVHLLYGVSHHMAPQPSFVQGCCWACCWACCCHHAYTATPTSIRGAALYNGNRAVLMQHPLLLWFISLPAHRRISVGLSYSAMLFIGITKFKTRVIQSPCFGYDLIFLGGFERMRKKDEAHE